MNILHNFATVGVQDDDISISNSLSVKHWHLSDEGDLTAIKMQTWSEEVGLNGLCDTLERNVEVSLVDF